MTSPDQPPPTQETFLWGVSTSAYQHEGGYNQSGQPLNNWAWAEHEKRVETSGVAADFWNRWAEDFSRCQDLGLTAFRLGISWSRVQPTTTLSLPKKPLAPPPFDWGAMEHYAKIIADCQAAGLEPILTLQHFTHPLWLGLDAWLHVETIDLYLEYVRKVVSFLVEWLPEKHGCRPPKYFITINEPNILASCTYISGNFPSGVRGGLKPYTICLGHLLEAHVRARNIIHQIYRESGIETKPMVSFNNYCSDLYWNDQAWLDLMFAPSRGIPRNRLFIHLWEEAWKFDRVFHAAKLPIHPWIRMWSGEFLKKAQHFLAYSCSYDRFWTRLVDLIYENPEPSLDYLAVDYYDPFAAHALRWPHWNDQFGLRKKFHERLVDGITSKWWDWKQLPEGLGFFVRTLSRFDRPILIAENGMAHRCETDESCMIRRDKLHRSDFIRTHIEVITRLRKEGYPIFGYLYWSMVDNYEWGTYAARFGLYSVNFRQSQERLEVAFSGDNAAKAYSEAIKEAEASLNPPLKI